MIKRDGKMKRLILLLIAGGFLFSCATVPHKTQETKAKTGGYTYEAMVDPLIILKTWTEIKTDSMGGGWYEIFYKNPDTGIGQFGGKNQDALFRITGDIKIPYPVFSNYDCDVHVFNGDSNMVCEFLPEVDIAYLDPPYNQHPYGSNYFMLNALLDYEKPDSISNISGIPDDWNRSLYNKNKYAYLALSDLVDKIKAKYLLISFNSEGFIPLDQMIGLLEKYGKLEVLETKYNAFRGSRNLNGREIHLKEYLYLLEKK